MKENKISSKDIELVWKEYKLGKINNIQQLVYGAINEGFIVNKDLIIRFNSKYTNEYNRFLNEKVAFELLANNDVIVPDVIVLDESRELIPFDFIILSRLKGKNIAESHNELNKTQLNNLIYVCGQTLAKIHNIVIKSFGDLHSIDTKEFSTWTEYIITKFNRYIRSAKEQNIFEYEIYKKLYRILENTKELFNELKTASLIHVDYHYENILQDNGELSGVLDFEHSVAGDPTFDFFTSIERERVIPNSEDIFFNGYESIRKLDKNHSKRDIIYKIFNKLDSVIMYINDKRDVYAKKSYSEMLELIDKTHQFN